MIDVPVASADLLSLPRLTGRGLGERIPKHSRFETVNLEVREGCLTASFQMSCFMENAQTPLLRPIAQASFALLLAVSLSGCSTFHREWKQAAAQPAPTDDISGGWQGMWKSEATGHEGTLRC